MASFVSASIFTMHYNYFEKLIFKCSFQNHFDKWLAHNNLNAIWINSKGANLGVLWTDKVLDNLMYVH
jgi:hypothetical protein